MNILFVNCCISQKKDSRTQRLCRAFIDVYHAGHPDDVIDELVLQDAALACMTADSLDRRDRCIQAGDYSDPMFDQAHRFARADKIIIGAPYWDMSFPALLKVYIENISVRTIAFHYTENGLEGLCRAGKMVYLLTSGGYVAEADSGVGYLRDICSVYCAGTFDVISAEGLDIQGLDSGLILSQACDKARALAARW